MEHYSDIRDVIARVRARWRQLHAFRAVVRAALSTTAVLGIALMLSRWTSGAPVALVALAAVSVLTILGLVGWALAPLRHAPADLQVARFIEEKTPALDDRLVTAVDVAEGRSMASPLIAGPLVADAAQRARSVDVTTVIPSEALRRAGFQAAAAALVCVAVMFFSRGTARQALDAASLTVWPARVALDVTPGHAKVKAGAPLAIHARLVGNRAPVIAQLQIADVSSGSDGSAWRTTEMKADRGVEGFGLRMDSVNSSFRYRIVAGAVTSPTYDVTVVHPPRVARIDVDYTYPEGLRLAPRTESDGGDIYAPAGTNIRVHVFADRPAATSTMALAKGSAIALTSSNSTEFTGTFDLAADNSYRIALTDADGISTPGETEYFIRLLEDRPPEVRILKPAADRSVTRLEEVDLEVQAEDDYGVDRLDLVYSVRGSAEKVVPLSIAKSTAVSGRHTLFLEDLDVQPGDFVSYYARARDMTTHGTRPNEARSDIFFLEVKPYEQEFALAQSQGGMAGAARTSLDDLVAAQKEVVVTTWKLEKRALSGKGAKSEQDIRSVSRAESELKTRVEETSSSFRESTMRDPRRGQGRGGRGGPPQPAQPPPLKAGETLPEENDMAAAAAAMGKAVTSLDGLKTGDALPPEMEALNRLLKAQAAVKKREVTQQQAGSGNGSNHSNVDLSTLFDRELQKSQQTNYETKSSAEQKSDPSQSALDKIKDLARRQDELLKKQQELAKNRDKMSEEQLKREIEKLTREQSELRQRAEEIARQTAGQNQGDRSRQQQQQQGGSEGGRQSQSGQQTAAGQSGQGGQQGQAGQQGASGRMRDASEEMRSATSDLRRQDADQAAAAGNRALQRLREAQRNLEAASAPDERRRAVGDLQLEARQLADSQRQVASELAKTPTGEAGKDNIRRLAGDQERLADRARQLEDSLRQQGAAGRDARSSSGRGGRGGDAEKSNAQAQAAAGEAAKELGRQKLADRMQQSAEAMRQASSDAGGMRGNTAPSGPADRVRDQVAPQKEMARSLERIADSLASGTAAADGESRKLSEQMARAQELRERMASASRNLADANNQAGKSGRSSQGNSGRQGESGKQADGSQGGGRSASSDANKLREEYMRQLQQTKELIDQIRRDDPSLARGAGPGFTFEEATRQTVTAPGTEAFKQDFAKWEELRRQATQALENIESSLAKKLQAKRSKDRLAAGADDQAPPEYRRQVDDYFKAIAKRKQ